MIKKYLFSILGVIITIGCYCQTNQVIVPNYIRISGDSVETVQVIKSINGFLNHAENSNGENFFVAKENEGETFALLDEIKGMANEPGSGKADFFKCYLNNAVLIGDHQYIIQLSFLGNYESNPVLRASFTFGLKKNGDRYFIYSLLSKNTDNWHMKKVDKFVFYYKSEPNATLINRYVNKAIEFDKKLNAKSYVTYLYYCDNFLNALKLIGTDYKLDYNSIAHNDLSSFVDDKYLRLVGSSVQDSSVFDIHDLWHNRLHNVMEVKDINKPVDEGCAYLYGGSWGINWKEILKRFRNNFDPNSDWLAIYNTNKSFNGASKYPLYPSYVINALLVQKLEKENNFEAVVKLLRCGKVEPGNENYFKELELVLGITKSNFSSAVKRLIQQE